MSGRRLVVGAAIVGVLLVTALVGAATLVRRSSFADRSGAGEAQAVSSTGQGSSVVPASTPPAQGLGCIHGGTTREEVRAIMGEPDSVAFGDWIYGRSSVAFGYGVVLDYSNAGGNLVICP